VSTPRGFSAAEEELDTRRIGGEIFSKVKTGIVDPSTLVRDSELPWIPPEDFPNVP
jgi:hypothetical protein